MLAARFGKAPGYTFQLHPCFHTYMYQHLLPHTGAWAAFCTVNITSPAMCWKASFLQEYPTLKTVNILLEEQGNIAWLSSAGKKGCFASASSKSHSTVGQSPVAYLNKAQFKNHQVNRGTYICHFGLRDWTRSHGQK